MSELFEEFRELRKILCLCPCCGEIVRVSDLHLKVKGTTIKTWLDSYEDKLNLLRNKEEKFEGKKDKLREKAREMGRLEAEKVFNRSIFPAFKAMKLDPFDIKPIMNPVDFIVFDGMTNKEEISKVMFLSKKTDILSLNNNRIQVKRVIDKKEYSWHVGRIDEEGNIAFE